MTYQQTSKQNHVLQLAQKAKQAQFDIANASTNKKNTALEAIATLISNSVNDLIEANEKDVENARQKGLDEALIDRLILNETRINQIVIGLKQVASLKDPLGEIHHLTTQPSGIQVGKMCVPLGVIGIIYESRPNVTIDAASLCLKSGNACILRGGSEAIHSNRLLARLINQGLQKAGLNSDAVQFIDSTSREDVGTLIKAEQYVDVIIPRGGKGLIQRITEEARVPVIKHLDGICHTYIDNEAEKDKAISIAFNAKTNRYGTCNTTETLILHQDVVDSIFTDLYEMYKNKGVELFGDEHTQSILGDKITCLPNINWSTEYLAPKLSIKIVESIDEAISHINRYSSQHTESIITENYTKALKFLREVDSSSVMVNASTRFADGFEYGLGAEIGISTNKLHARGPVGLEGLTTDKWIVFGHGEIRQ